MQHHPDSEAANEIAAIVMKHLGWVKLDKRYAIANDVLNWLDSRKKDSVEVKKHVVKYQVNYIESERGLGTKIDDVVYFDTESEAREAVTKSNKDLPRDRTPDYYYMAQYVGPVIREV